MFSLQRIHAARYVIKLALLLLLLASQTAANPFLQETTIRDGFSDAGEWALADGFDIQGGTLKLTINNANQAHMQALPGENTYQQLTVGLDTASKAEGFYTYHIWFNMTDAGSGYAFSMTPSLGFYTVDLWEDGEFRQFLQANTFSDVINRDGSNYLGLVVIDGTMTLFINEQAVQTINDDTHLDGAILLGATAVDPSIVPLVLSFDNLLAAPTADPALLDEPFSEDEVVAEAEETTPQIAEAPQDSNVIFNVPIARGGIEIFPAPDRSSGRLHAATGAFEPHIAGKDESGDWVFIYYFDGGWQAGWSPTSQVTLEVSDIAALAVIDPQDPPELPDLTFSETAVLPFGVGAPAANADEPEEADGSGDTPAEAEPVAGGNHAPVIHSAQLNGACENMTMVVAWSDIDGDALRFEHRRSPGGSSIEGLTQGFSGSGSTHVVPNLYCEAASCGGYLVIVDANGNESRPVLVTVDC